MENSREPLKRKPIANKRKAGKQATTILGGTMGLAYFGLGLALVTNPSFFPMLEKAAAYTFGFGLIFYASFRIYRAYQRYINI